jgi:hypothetical protein
VPGAVTVEVSSPDFPVTARYSKSPELPGVIVMVVDRLVVPPVLEPSIVRRAALIADEVSVPEVTPLPE